ncbi:hypothetical protein [Streptomyces sp. NPDC029526]|uniref:hypothetical protein n=1 Tax=Streptomyces sp. NPDC029526 TaxID=3155728 RepID=UPI00340E48CB
MRSTLLRAGTDPVSVPVSVPPAPGAGGPPGSARGSRPAWSRTASALSAAALACLLLGGCTGSPDTAASSPRETGSPDTTVSSPLPSGAPAEAPDAPRLEVPAGARMLVAETGGSGSRDLPTFTPPDKVYTVYAECTGPGEVTLVDRDGAGTPHRVLCDGAGIEGVVHTDGEPQRLAMRVTGGASTWKVAVVSGEQSG